MACCSMPVSSVICDRWDVFSGGSWSVAFAVTRVLQGGPWPEHSFNACTLKACHVGLRRLLPCRAAGVKIGALSHRMPLGIVIQKSDRRCRDGIGIVKRDNDAAPICEKIFGMPVRSRDDCFPRSECDRKCAGNDLRLLAIGSDVDVGSAHMLNQFF